MTRSTSPLIIIIIITIIIIIARYHQKHVQSCRHAALGWHHQHISLATHDRDLLHNYLSVTFDLFI